MSVSHDAKGMYRGSVGKDMTETAQRQDQIDARLGDILALTSPLRDVVNLADVWSDSSCIAFDADAQRLLVSLQPPRHSVPRRSELIDGGRVLRSAEDALKVQNHAREVAALCQLRTQRTHVYEFMKCMSASPAKQII